MARDSDESQSGSQIEDRAAASPTEHPDSPDKPGSRSRLSYLVFGLVALGLASLLGLLLAEVSVRLLIPVTDVVWSFWDPVIGTRRTPGQDGVFIRPAGPHGHFSFNAQGWNYPEAYEIEAPTGLTRVCVIGDSFVEAMQVDVEESMAMVAQRAMTGQDSKAQWYPFGISGFGLAQHYLVLHHYVTDYRPDAVVVLLVPNDLYDGSPFLVSSSAVNNTLHLDEQGTTHLFQARPFNSSWSRRLVYSTALGRLLFAQYQVHRRRGDLRQASHKVFLRDEQGGNLLLGQDLTPEQRAVRSWQHGEDMMRLIRDDCSRIGATLLFAYCGNTPRLNAAFKQQDFVPPPRENDPYCMGERIWEMGNELFEPAAARLGVPYLDLTEPLMGEIRRAGQRPNFEGDDHYSVLGHRIVGEALARRVGELLSEKKRSLDPAFN